MHEVNGVDLTSSEYEELKRLVEECDDSSEFVENVNARLLDAETNTFNADLAAIHVSLKRKRMIYGAAVFGGFIFEGVTPMGKCFVRDLESVAAERRREMKSDRRHDFAVAVVEASIGFVLGVAAEHSFDITGQIFALIQLLA